MPGKATFDVPEFQGALRLMAVAHQGKQFGAAAHTTRVRRHWWCCRRFRFLSLCGDRADSGHRP